MSVLTLTKENFKASVSSGMALVDFWASWCGPCMMQSPIVDEVAEERADITVGKVNVDEQPELAAAFNVESIPTLLIIKNGTVADVLVGLHSKEQILAQYK